MFLELSDSRGSFGDLEREIQEILKESINLQMM